MGTPKLPMEVLEKILSYVDAETLMNCEKVSPEFAAAVNYVSSRDKWKHCCMLEISRHDIELQIIGKLYPHHPHFDCPRTWKEIYKCWSSLKKLTTIKTWNISVLRGKKKFSQVLQVATHGDLILALIRYGKNIFVYYKIVTIDSDGTVCNKSCRFNYQTLFLAPFEGTLLDDDIITLDCKKCNLVGIPSMRSNPGRREYPKIAMGANKINIFQSNGEYLFFRNCLGILDKSNCGSLKETAATHTSTFFVRVASDFSNLYITCGDVYREFAPFQSLHSKITCTKYFACVLLLGTDTGMVYGYYCKDQSDFLHLELTNYNWKFDVSSQAIISLDLMVTNDKIAIICCDNTTIFKLEPEVNDIPC